MKRERTDGTEERERKRGNQPLSGGLGWPRRRATSRRRSSHHHYHPSLHSLPPVARWATLRATIHLTLLADPVPRTFSRATDRSQRPSVYLYVHPSVNLPLYDRYASVYSRSAKTYVRVSTYAWQDACKSHCQECVSNLRHRADRIVDLSENLIQR